MPTEKEIQLESELKALKAAKEEAEKSLHSAEQKQKDEVEQLQSELKEFKAKALDAEKKQKEAELDAFIESLPKLSPAMKPFVKELLGEEKKTYSVEKKEFTRQDLVKEMLALYAKALDVNLEENSDEGEEDDGLASKIEKYMQENKVTDYAKAYKAVMREVTSKEA